MPIEVKLPPVAFDCDVTMPLPPHPPPLRPDWINPVTPSYTPPLAVPTGEVVISLLSSTSSRAPPVTETAPVLMTFCFVPLDGSFNVAPLLTETDDEVVSDCPRS